MPPPFSRTELKPFAIDDLSIGLISDLDQVDVPLGGASACNNYVYVDGYLRPRPGVLRWDTSAGPPPANRPIVALAETYAHSLLGAQDVQTNQYKLVLNPATWEVTLYITSGGAAWTAIPNPMPGIIPVQFYIPPTWANWKEKLWIATGKGLYYYDPITYVGPIVDVNAAQPTIALRVPNDPRLLVAGDSRLFIADCSDKNDGTGTRVFNRVAWSDQLDGTVWGGGSNAGTSGFVDLGHEPITGLYYANSTLLVFNTRTLFIGTAGTPPLTYEFKQRFNGVGCVSHQTIRSYKDGWIFWLGDDNIYRGGTDRTPEAVGDHIRPRLREIANTYDFYRATAIIDHTNHLYHLFLPYIYTPNSAYPTTFLSGLSGTNVAQRCFKVFTLNLKNGSWWEGELKYTGADITSTLEHRAGPWDTRLLLGDADGKVREMSFSYTSDDGTAIPSSWTSGVLSVPTVTQGATDQASLQLLRVMAASGSVRLGAYVGDGMDRMTFADFGVQTCNGSSPVYTSSRPYAGENFKINLSNTTAASPAKVSKIIVGAILEGPTRK